ncbi:MAG: serine/threonine protein kinase [Rubripirellula sp.]
MTDVSSNRSKKQCKQPAILGIWRLGEVIHESSTTQLSLAQPADAVGSPRWDYVIKRARNGADQLEGNRQILQSIAAASCATHPNLIALLDASTTSNQPYMVMPRLEGEPMQSHLESTTSKPLPVALWLVRQLAQALDSLHTTGWVHGDVKPENSVVGSRGHVTLVDLGFASRIHTLPNHHFRGTPDYAAPEALAGTLAAIPAMDIFSLGRVLWHWITRTEQVSQAMLEPVADLVQQMVSKNPNERPTAAEVVQQLLSLEIETLGRHIGPANSNVVTAHRRAA